MAEALRLADELDDVHTTHVARNAAAELRRLHAENERLHQINQSHEMKLSVRGYEIQIAGLEAQRDAMQERAEYWKRKHDDEETGAERYALRVQRDALLGALKLARSIIGHPDDAHSQMIDAAIAAVEGEDK